MNVSFFLLKEKENEKMLIICIFASFRQPHDLLFLQLSNHL